MNKKIYLFLIMTMSLFYVESQAQPGGRMSPEDRVMREKQNLYSKIDDLSDDQTMIIDGIYDEYAQSIKESFEEIRKNRNWEEMRAKMEALNEEKDGLMFDILSQEQYVIYEEMTTAQRERMKERQGNRKPGEGAQ
ncbi:MULTISPECIES: hypothetical protein [Reichenbachiella]|uniref:LTXXQ motif family protein n=1 Tax=Reichenbachiella agariperforans TaxID=156994 RepID=A0A1M6NTJ0_REIAG|nr:MULTISPECIES: hypothetical protein [Reichenbachiella]RJE71727.1 hypothetical protein BGP76_06465 [Reichenbachiella sp. MSK19-1]SHJ99047.1 hypothetical protein SAMN04488028_102402 [Reichenbachiella agariperforans]